MATDNTVALRNAVYALADMFWQFSYVTTFRGKYAFCADGKATLENAISALRDCGCKVNRNGTVSEKNLIDFMDALKAEPPATD